MTVLTTPQEVAAWLESLPLQRILGIIGPPGSGKSTFAHELSTYLHMPHKVVPMDGFHYRQDTLRAMNRRERMGAADTFDTVALATLLRQVISRSEPVIFPEFDRSIEEPVPGMILVHPSDELIVLEGNYLLAEDDDWSKIGPLLDMSIYIDIPEVVRLERLLTRHLHFGKTASEAAEWINRVDETNARIIEATKPSASIVYQPAS